MGDHSETVGEQRTFNGGRFRTEAEIRAGRAYRCVDERDGKAVFVKRWAPGDDAFQRERDNIVRIRDRHFPKFVASWEDESGSYLAEEWLSGIDLEELVRKSGPLEPARAAKIGLKVCEALSYLQDAPGGAAVFMDLKPSNVLISGAVDDEPEVWLTDLEAAIFLASGQAKAAGRDDPATLKLGSMYYTAPEALFGEYCIASDVYSLGVLAGFMITGREDYPSSYGLKGFWGEFMASCTAHEPEGRYRSAEEAAGALKKYLEGNEEAGSTVDTFEAEKALRGSLKAIGAKTGGPGGDRVEMIEGQGGRRVAKIDKKSEKTDRKQGVKGAGDDKSASGRSVEADKPKGALSEIIRQSLIFRRLCVTVEGNPCFVSEMGMAASRSMDLKTGLFTLSERGRRNLEYYFTGEEESGAVAEKAIYPYVFDHRSMYLHNAYEWVKRGLLTPYGDEGRVLRGTFKLGLEIPLRRREDVRRFIEWCFVNFDLTLISAERSDDSELVNTAMESCSYVVATPDSNVEDMEAIKNYYLALADSGKLLYSKVRFVAWDFTEPESDRNRLFKVVGKDRYLGEVRRSELTARRKNRVEGLGPVGDQGELEQYEEILQKLIG